MFVFAFHSFKFPSICTRDHIYCIWCLAGFNEQHVCSIYFFSLVFELLFSLTSSTVEEMRKSTQHWPWTFEPRCRRRGPYRWVGYHPPPRASAGTCRRRGWAGSGDQLLTASETWRTRLCLPWWAGLDRSADRQHTEQSDSNQCKLTLILGYSNQATTLFTVCDIKSFLWTRLLWFDIHCSK